MIIVPVTLGIISVDMDNTLKVTYPTHKIYLNNTAIGTILPINIPLVKGVNTLKVVMNNTNSIYSEENCYLWDDDLKCETASYYANLDNSLRGRTNVPFLYTMLLNGTNEVTNCGCLCEDLKTIYQDIKDEIFPSC